MNLYLSKDKIFILNVHVSLIACAQSEEVVVKDVTIYKKSGRGEIAAYFMASLIFVFHLE